MARRFISELVPGESVENCVFRIASKDLRTGSNGVLYIHAVLADKSGEMLARLWQATADHYKLMPEGGFVRFRGRIESYKGNLQFIIDGLSAVDEGEVDIADFLPASKHDPEKMWQQVKAVLRTVQDRDILQLIKEFVEDEALVAAFKRAPAAVSMHHAYVGGLLEHTLNVLELAVAVMPRYPQLNADLVVAGLFLHDIGKTRELSHATNFAYTDCGQLLGHIVQGVILIEEKARFVGQRTGAPFPEAKKWLLQHIVLAHHGTYEHGSPRLPAFPEAYAVHHLDNLDAKIHQALQAIEEDKDADSSWTTYQRALATRIYKRSATDR